jgi:thioredoxin-like negative regulator of GroEL
MAVRRAKIASLILVVGLIAVLAPVCGCSSTKKPTTKETNSTSPALTAQGTAPRSQSTTPSNPDGQSNSEVALEEAKAEGKPVLLNFHSTRCIPCIQIEKNINKIKPEYERRVDFIVVDIYDQQENNLTTKYGIETIPTTFFVGKDGSVVNKYVGVLEPDQLKKELEALL